MQLEIWHDFMHSKFGEEYLNLYLNRGQNHRKASKLIVILFSAGGIFSVLKNYSIPSIVSMSIIGIIEIFSKIEGLLILTDHEIEKLIKLRLLYYEKSLRLEELFVEIRDDNIDEPTARKRYFKIKKEFIEAERIDNELNIKKLTKLIKKAEDSVNLYIKRFYYE